MTDREIFGNIFDAMRAGTDTVSKNLFIFILFFKKKHNELIHFLKIHS